MAYGANRLRTTLAYAARDFAISLVVFWGLVVTFNGLHSPAHAIGPANLETTLAAERGVVGSATGNQASPYAAVARAPLRQLNALQASAQPTLFLLSLVVALLMASNLAFLRHLRRAYAKPKSGRVSGRVRGNG